MQLAWIALTLGMQLSATPREELDEGKRLMSKLDERKAAARFEQGLALDPAPELRAELLIHLGLARFELLDTEGARAAFLQALEANPQSTLPRGSNPRAMAVFEEARELKRPTAIADGPRLPAPVTPNRPSYLPAILLLAGSVVVAGAGVAFGQGAQAAVDRAAASDWAEARSGWNAIAQNRAWAANGCFAASAVLGTLGVGLTIWPWQSQGAQVVVSGTWDVAHRSVRR
jgi:hypothetical protein